jgi:replicative DNA helicase
LKKATDVAFFIYNVIMANDSYELLKLPPDMLKLPPHSIEAEQSVIGGLLLENEALDKIADILKPTDFYQHDHKLIYGHIVKLLENNKPADIVTVAESLEASAELTGVGGIAYLGSLAQNTPTAANIRRYAEVVREYAVMRQLVEAGSSIADSAYNRNGRNAEELLDQAESKIFQIAESNKRSTEGFQGMNVLLPQVAERIDELFSRDNQSDVTGIPTGFADLDSMTSGLHGGDLIIVAGRPSMGKTAFSINIAENIALDTGLPVAVFSMEMGATQLATRMIGSVGRLDQHRMRTGKLEDEDWEKLTTALGKLNEAPIYIDEGSALTAFDVRARARRLHRQTGKLGLIVIDYLQLMSGSSNKQSENRATEISEISRSLKGLAKELDVPVIALSQLNRSVETRPDKRPMMSDLRESGAIEQDADLILFIYRDEVYNPDSTDKGTAEIIIGKQRNGPIGRVRLTFIGQNTRFENFANPGYMADEY